MGQTHSHSLTRVKDKDGQDIKKLMKTEGMNKSLHQTRGIAKLEISHEEISMDSMDIIQCSRC